MRPLHAETKRVGRDGVEEVRRGTLVGVVLLTCALGVLWIGMHLYLGLWAPTVPVVAYIGLSAVNLAVYWLTKRFARFRLIQLVLVLLLPAATQIAYGGFVPSGVVILPSLLAPAAALMYHQVRTARVLAFGFFVLVVAAGVLEGAGLVYQTDVAAEVSLMLVVVNVLFTTATLYFMFEYFVKQRNRLSALVVARNEALEEALDQLKATQTQLIQQEKMASLGALTAGIAHEIKNPLNFVTNFSGVSSELVDELRDALQRGDGDEADAILADLRLNASKIHEHGQRADTIVRSMMQHARGGKGDRQAVDLNALVDEYVSLAYHGKRASTPDFHVEIERDYDERVGEVVVVPQDVGRVVLNLVSNAFDAVAEHAVPHNGQERRLADHAYAPQVTVRTRREEGQVEIRVEDNGPGISPDVREKIFEPFFTTKPTGSGTGLGLSMSYDIVTQGHGGTLTVESAPGEGAAFVVRLPRPAASTAALARPDTAGDNLP